MDYLSRPEIQAVIDGVNNSVQEEITSKPIILIQPGY